MEALLASGIGILVAAGIFLLLRSRTFDVVLGFSLLSYAVNLFIFSMGRPVVAKAPIVRPDLAPTLSNYADPLPQALVLTAIVISFGMTALLLVLALRSRRETGSDQVDATEGSG